jgi:hypothetical protein
MRDGDQLAADAGEGFLDGVLVHAGGDLVLVRDHLSGVPCQVLVAVAGQPVQRRYRRIPQPLLRRPAPYPCHVVVTTLDA